MFLYVLDRVVSPAGLGSLSGGWASCYDLYRPSLPPLTPPSFTTERLERLWAEAIALMSSIGGTASSSPPVSIALPTIKNAAMPTVAVLLMWIGVIGANDQKTFIASEIIRLEWLGPPDAQTPP